MSGEPIVLTDEETAQVYAFLRYSYININKYGVLARLVDRCGARVRQTVKE